MSRTNDVRRGACGLALACALALAGAAADASTILRFDAFVGGVGVTSYEESGYRLGSDASIFAGTTALADPPGVFSSQATGTLFVERISERPFDAVSILVREINGSVGPVSVLFTGELAAGGTVTTTFTSDGVCCGVDPGVETVVFPETFRGLRSLSWVRADAGSVGVFDDVELDFPALRFAGFAGGASSYAEAGLQLDSSHPINASSTFVPEPPAIFASQGFQTFELRSEDGGVLELQALEIRELNETIGATQFTLIGRRLDGTTVDATFTTDGACCGGERFGFELFELPETFTQLVAVEWSETGLVYDTFEATLVAPDNDAAGAAIPLGGGIVSGSLVRATNDATVSLGDSAASPDVWYALSPAVTTEFRVDTCGTDDGQGIDSGADTVVTVHGALPASDANQLAGNDDAPDGDDPQACAGLDGGNEARDAALRVEVAGGSTAWIRVARAGGSSAGGDFTLRVPEPGATLAGGAALAALAALGSKRRRPGRAGAPAR